MKQSFFCFLLVFAGIFAGCEQTEGSLEVTSSPLQEIYSETPSFEAVSSDIEGVSSEDISSEDVSSEDISSEDVSSKNGDVYDGPVADGYEGFITVSGQKLVDENGKEYQIKGIAFGNNVFGNPSYAPSTHHTKQSYEFLSDIGLNSVRFYLNYGLFEDDHAPYEYKQSGWDWLDKNIAWAKEHGIRLVLNMHYPQGGYQSQGNGYELWTKPENMNRLTALWTEIARRYADEPTILGYGLINEPFVAVEKPTDAMPVYEEAVQNMVDSIRTVDENHLIFVEKIHTVQTIGTWTRSWPQLNNRCNFPEIYDDNVVYEFHFYDPLSFTHQWNKDELVAYPYKDSNGTYDKDDMQSAFNRYISFSEANDVPIYCGEFGASTDCFKEGAGGELWAADILDVLMENGINFNYHAFHEEMFGLYGNSAYSYPDKLNIALRDVFIEKLAK